MPARSKTTDSDTPPLSTERILRMRPATEVLPKKFLDAHRRRREAAQAANDPPLPKSGGRSKTDEPKQAVSIQLDSEVIERLREGGAGWRTRINDLLRKALNLAARS